MLSLSIPAFVSVVLAAATVGAGALLGVALVLSGRLADVDEWRAS